MGNYSTSSVAHDKIILYCLLHHRECFSTSDDVTGKVDFTVVTGFAGEKNFELEVSKLNQFAFILYTQYVISNNIASVCF